LHCTVLYNCNVVAGIGEYKPGAAAAATAAEDGDDDDDDLLE
jgi:hypothetical protein